MEEQADKNKVQEQSVNPVPVSKKPNYWIIAGIILVLLIVFGVIFALSLPSRKPISPPPKPLVSPSPISPTPTPDETANWKTYDVKTLQLQFGLPPKFSVLGELKENVESVSVPFTGKRLCAMFPKKTSFADCELNYFLIITISSDYNVGRGAGFGDLQGFTYREGNYYGKLLRKEFEIPTNLVQKINNKNGVEIIKIKSTYAPSEEEPLPIYYVGENIVGALVNTPDNTFPGFTVLFELKDGFTEGDFDQILSTFQFSN